MPVNESKMLSNTERKRYDTACILRSIHWPEHSNILEECTDQLRPMISVSDRDLSPETKLFSSVVKSHARER